MNELTRHPAAASVPANVSDHSINSESQDGGLGKKSHDSFEVAVRDRKARDAELVWAKSNR